MFCGEMLLAPRPTIKLENYQPTTVSRLCIEIFTNNFHICRPSPPCASQLHEKPWWQGLTYHECSVLISENAYW